MGTTYINGTNKQDVVNIIIKTTQTKEAKHETLQHKVVGKILWTVGKVTNNDGKSELFIGCYLLSKDGNRWGYKDLCEGMHPYYYDCPLKFLDMVPVACQEWRDKVKKYHEKKLRKFDIGDVVKLEGCTIPEATVVSVKPFLGKYNDKLYRLKKEFVNS